MKALILSAGQGKRLLPLTAKSPKCVLPILGRSLIEWQIDELHAAGIKKVTVVVGYGADQVERLVRHRYGNNGISFLYNSEFDKTDNLVSCWMARREMDEDFILLNGDTLFEASVIRLVLEAPSRPVTVMTNDKSSYDADDMKVTLQGEQLMDIGKDLEPVETDGESVGIILFRGEGPALFRSALEEAVEDPTAGKKWYLSVIREMSRTMPVWTCSIEDRPCCEVDYPVDLKNAEKVVQTFEKSREAHEMFSSVITLKAKCLAS